MLTENHSRQDLCEIRDLGKRLAMSFGIDLHRVRKPLVALHMSVKHMAILNTYTPDVSCLSLSLFSFDLTFLQLSTVF